jgi:hypothetical protein
VLDGVMGLPDEIHQTWTVCSGRPYKHVHTNRNVIRNLKPMAAMSPWLYSSVKGRVMACAYHRHGLKISNLLSHRSVVCACSYAFLSIPYKFEDISSSRIVTPPSEPNF